jgi:uncharacterized protein with HEPN domain
MRDILVHSYFGVNLGLTWLVATDDIKKLEKQTLDLKKKIGKPDRLTASYSCLVYLFCY